MASTPTTIPAGQLGEPQTTASEDIEAALETLHARAPGWCATSVTDRIELLSRLTEDVFAAAPAWVNAASAAKGLRRDSPLMGEEWSSGVLPVLRMLKGLETSLLQIEQTGRPQPPSLGLDPDGRVVARVFAADWIDRLSVPGFSAEVRLQQHVSLAQAAHRIGGIYRNEQREPGVAVVLGAGNNSSIPPLDVLHQLFAEDRVVVLKMSPVNAYLGPHYAEAFAALVEAGLLRIVYGGDDVGRQLVEHERITAVHLTGSNRTYEQIVFGEGEDGERRRAAREPRFDKPLVAELGSVTPVIVVPGPWSATDLHYHGDNIATMLVQNAGFNCLSTRMIIQHRAWAKRGQLLEAVRGSLRHAEDREPYYPGARERWERLLSEHRSAELFGREGDDRIPFTLVPELEPDRVDDPLFTEETFCAAMAEVALDAPRSVPEFIDDAVAFCNSTLAGSLAAMIIVHPRSLRDPMIAEAVDRAIDGLRYGVVSVNHWVGVAYGLASPSWGGHPDVDVLEGGSGVGTVHNSFLLQDVEKSVVRGPFRTPQTPAWFHTNRQAHRIWPQIAEVTALRRAGRVPTLLWHSARG